VAAQVAGLALERALEVAFEQSLSFPATLQLFDENGSVHSSWTIEGRWGYGALHQFYDRPVSAVPGMGARSRPSARVQIGSRWVPRSAADLGTWAKEQGWLSPHETRVLVSTIRWCRHLEKMSGSYDPERYCGNLRDAITLTNRLWARKELQQPIHPLHAYVE
jgi:hypothetical protein